MAITQMDYTGGGGGGTPKSAPISGTWAGDQVLTVSGLAHKPVGFSIYMSNNKYFTAYGEQAYEGNLTEQLEWGTVTYTNDGFSTSKTWGGGNYTYKGLYFYNE